MNANDAPEFTLDLIQEKFYSAVISDALDSVGLRRQSPPVDLVAMTGIPRLAGRCKTTLWADMAHPDPKPYDLELQALDDCKPGDVFIAAAGGSLRSGIWGELLTTAAKNGGCLGALIDGAVRDIDKIAAMKFPVFARGRSIYDSLNRQRVIDVDVPVDIGGVTFSPGDLVFADADGVVVVPRQVEEEVLQRAWQKIHAESAVRDAIRGGMKAVAAYKKYGVL
jgi:4-hydroxy-4-methyl-2-oxoglutarate aldolase